MAFKASKIEIDLTLDLTEFIPEEKGGILKSIKTDGESIFEWTKFTIAESERIQKIKKDNFEFTVVGKEIIEEIKEGSKITNVNLTEISRESIIKQIDFFYGKGIEFYRCLHLETLRDIVEYIRSQVAPVKKKSLKSKK